MLSTVGVNRLKHAIAGGTSISKLFLENSGLTRAISLSSVSRLKEINKMEEGNKIVIEGKHVPSPREKYLVAQINSPMRSLTSSGRHEACPCSICKLNLQIKHTDVLILSQFTTSNGKQLPRTVTGLCKEQHKRVDYLLVMAEKAGLIDTHTNSGKRELVGWERFNKYYDESVIDGFLQHKRKRHC